MDYNTTRHVNCHVCGKGFMDDCGGYFCSSYCEDKHEYDHKQCEKCLEVYGGDNLNFEDICENCEEEENEDEA